VQLDDRLASGFQRGHRWLSSRPGAVTVAFEPFGFPEDSYTNFLHLDFMPEGDVRIDDGPVRFGHFSRDQVFALAVGLNITATAATAHHSCALGCGLGAPAATRRN
jgi:hypothetical protein